MQGEGQEVAVSPGSGAPPAKPDALVAQGGMATGLLRAGPAAKRPALEAAAADITSLEVLCFATVPTAPYFGYCGASFEH